MTADWLKLLNKEVLWGREGKCQDGNVTYANLRLPFIKDFYVNGLLTKYRDVDKALVSKAYAKGTEEAKNETGSSGFTEVLESF